MVALNRVERLRQPPGLDSYHQMLASDIAGQLLLHRLPGLADLPLELADADGAPCRLEALLQRHRHLTLAGASGSGRQLAMLQYALRWATGAEPSASAPVLVRLQHIDNGEAPPDVLLANYLRNAGPGAVPPVVPQRSLFRRAQPEQPPAYRSTVVLVNGLDELALERRLAWRATLQQHAASDSTMHLVVAVPEDEPPWPEFAPVAIARLTPAGLTAWIEHLTPPQHRAAIDSVLGPHRPLQPLGERLFEIALLAWLAPIVGIAQSRAELYAQALAQVLETPAERLENSPLVSDLQLLAAYDERPARAPAELIVQGEHGRLYFRHPLIRRYLAARQLAAEDRVDLLAHVELPEQRELALFLATLLDDPAPLYARLWEMARQSVEHILILACCLRERAPQNPAWALRIVAALAQVAREYPGPTRARAVYLLNECMAALDTALERAIAADPAVYQFLDRLLALLPADLATTRALRLALHAGTPAAFGWQLADWLIERDDLNLPISAPIPSDERVLARWIYLHALRDTGRRAALDPAMAQAALRALAAQADDARRLRAATALAGDTALAAPIRSAALELLGTIGQQSSAPLIERIADDPDPDIRQAALGAIGQIAPDRATIAWGRAALDRSADWELRLSAIQSLGQNLSESTAHQLAQCALDTRLPLFVRLYAIGALGRQAPGHAELHLLLGRSELSQVGRAAVARALGAAGYEPALRDLVRLVETAATSRVLLEACCDALGALRKPEATEPLLALLERAYQDPALTRAALRALGQIGDARASDVLARLLGAEAQARLGRGLAPRLLQQPIEASLDNSAVPPRIIEQLAVMQANAVTPEVQPTTLGEFLAAEADRIRVTAAQALVALGGNAARAALLGALLDDTAGGAAADLIATLAETGGPNDTDVLGYLLEAGEISPLTRWLVIQHLANSEAGEPLMLRALMNPALDAFTRGALAEALGQRRVITALPLLRQLAEDRAVDSHLRAQATLGLGLLNDTTTETILLRIAADPGEEINLRGLAADYLPDQLSPEGRRMLRELLRAEPRPAPLVIGALRTLGRARDHEALQLMLQYCQDTSGAIVQAAIDALADLGDASVAPKLVAIAQQSGADHALRLQAAGALLRIGGGDYRPLLMSYLQQGALPFRLLALEALIGADASPEDLRAMLAEREWPTALRLRLIEYLAGDVAAAPLLLRLLETEDDVPQLRALAAQALGRLRWQAAVPSLVRLALRGDLAQPIRIRCVEALGVLGGHPAWVAIGRLAEDEKQPTAIRDCALLALQAKLTLA